MFLFNRGRCFPQKPVITLNSSGKLLEKRGKLGYNVK
jgi:hypothetical protein